jgi:hypothetical protein
VSMPRNTRESVWGRVDQHETDECWPFVGAVNTYGYGQIRVDGKQELAHRLAFELATGISPGLLLVCHRCDNPRCCNPSHLFLGSVADNAQDAANKGRLPGARKLTEELVREIRRLAANGVTYAELGRRFGVTAENISSVCRRLTWRHV